MSYVLNAWVAPVPRDLDETALILDRLHRLAEREDPRLDDFVARLHARYPEHTDLPANSADDVWLDNSMARAPRGPVLAFGIQSKHIGRVLPFVVEQAAAANVILFDDQAGAVFLPDGHVVTLQGRMRTADLLRAPTDDESSRARRVLEGPAPGFAGAAYRLHLFYDRMSQEDFCAQHIEWASSQADPVAVLAAAQAQSRQRVRPYIEWEVGNVHNFDFTKMNRFAQRMNAALRAKGGTVPWADGRELDESAPRLMTTLDVRTDAIAGLWPLILAEAGQQGLTVHDPLQRLQAFPIGSFKIGQAWHGTGDDGADALEYSAAHAGPRAFALLEPALLAFGFKPKDPVGNYRSYERAHGQTSQELYFYLKKSGQGVGMETSLHVALQPGGAPELRWVPKAGGTPDPLVLRHRLLPLLRIATTAAFPVSQNQVLFYRDAHIPEFVDTLVGILRERLMPLLEALDSATAIFDLLGAPSSTWDLDDWRGSRPQLAHLIDSPDAGRLLAEEDAALRAWEHDNDTDDYPGLHALKSRRELLTRIQAQRDAPGG